MSGSSPAQAQVELYETRDELLNTCVNSLPCESWFIVFTVSFTSTCYLLHLTNKQKRRDLKWRHYCRSWDGGVKEQITQVAQGVGGSCAHFLNFPHSMWLKLFQNVILFGQWLKAVKEHLWCKYDPRQVYCDFHAARMLISVA